MQKLSDIFGVDKDLKQMMTGIIFGTFIGIAVTFFCGRPKKFKIEDPSRTS